MTTPEPVAGKDTITVDVVRQDVVDPDNACAELQFTALSDGDMELTIRWGNPPRNRGSFLIPGAAAGAIDSVTALMFRDLHAACAADMRRWQDRWRDNPPADDEQELGALLELQPIIVRAEAIARLRHPRRRRNRASSRPGAA